MPKTKTNKKLPKGSMEIVTIKFADSLATHQQQIIPDDLDDTDELEEFNL